MLKGVISTEPNRVIVIIQTESVLYFSETFNSKKGVDYELS